jgi:hypothetical protein
MQGVRNQALYTEETTGDAGGWIKNTRCSFAGNWRMKKTRRGGFV